MKLLFILLSLSFYASISAAQLRIAKDHLACAYGLKDSSNNWVLEPKYINISEIKPYGKSFYYVQSYEGYGFFDMQGKVLVPPIFTTATIERLALKNYFLVSNDQKQVGIFEDGELKIPMQYQYIKQDWDGAFFAYSNNSTTYIGSDFKVLWGPVPYFVNPFTNKEFAHTYRSSYYLKKKEKEIRPYGLTNRQGELIYPPIYNDIIFCSDNAERVFLFKHDTIIIETRARKVLQEFQGYVIPSHACSLCSKKQNTWIYKKNGKIGLMDCNFKPVTAAIYDQVQHPYGDFHVLRRGNKWGLFSPQGKVILDCIYKSIEFEQPNYWRMTTFDGKIGIIDNKGQEIVPCIYKEVYRRANWLARTATRKWGCYSMDGRELFSPIYDSIEYPVNTQNVFYLHKGQKKGIFNIISGKVIAPAEYSDIHQIDSRSLKFVCTKANYFHVYNDTKYLISPPCSSYSYSGDNVFFIHDNSLYSSSFKQLDPPKKHPTLFKNDNLWFVESLGRDTTDYLSFKFIGGYNFYGTIKNVQWSYVKYHRVNDKTFLLHLSYNTHSLVYHNDSNYVQLPNPVIQYYHSPHPITNKNFIIVGPNNLRGVWNSTLRQCVIKPVHRYITPWNHYQQFFVHDTSSTTNDHHFLLDDTGKKLFPHTFKKPLDMSIDRPHWVEYNGLYGYIDPSKLKWLTPPIYKTADHSTYNHYVVTTLSGYAGIVNQEGQLCVDTIYYNPYYRWSRGVYYDYVLFNDQQQQPLLVNPKQDIITNKDSILDFLVYNLEHKGSTYDAIEYSPMMKQHFLNNLLKTYHVDHLPQPDKFDAWAKYQGWNLLLDSFSNYSYTTLLTHTIIHGEQFISYEYQRKWTTYVDYQGQIRSIELADLFENESILLEELVKAIQARDDLNLDCSSPENWLYQMRENFSLSNNGIHLFLLTNNGDNYSAKLHSYQVFTIPWKNLTQYKPPINLAQQYLKDAKVLQNRRFIQASKNWAARILFFTYNAFLAGPIYGIW